MTLRKGQKELVETYRGGYCAVPAIPGGGKTYCLSVWATEMIEKGFNKPGKILIVTYMNSAVSNFKQRIASELEKRGIQANKDYVVCTIHGLCLQIIKEHTDKLYADEEFEIIDDRTRNNLLIEAIDEWKYKNPSQFIEFISDDCLKPNKQEDTLRKWKENLSRGILPSVICEFKSRGINPKNAISDCENLPEGSLLKEVSKIYEIYDRKLKIKGLMDFDDMLFNALMLLKEDAELLSKYRSRFSFVCEDEAQDSNLIQSEILELIANGNLLRVGDSNQAICGSFSNSDFELFKIFSGHCDTVKHSITESSRNTIQIIDIANYFVKYIRNAHPVNACRESLLPQFIEPVDKNDVSSNPINKSYGIHSSIFESWDEEARNIVYQADIMKQNHPNKTIAILVPTTYKIETLRQCLDYKGIEYEELDKNNEKRNRPLKMLGLALKFVLFPHDSRIFFEMLAFCFLQPRDNLIFNKPAFEAHIGYLENFINANNVEDIIFEFESIECPRTLENTYVWQMFKNSLSEVKLLLNIKKVPYDHLILKIAHIFNFEANERQLAQKIASDLSYKYLEKSNFLFELASELLQSRNSYSYLSTFIWELKGYVAKPGIITVSTYHKAKGMEWDIVFLTGITFSDFPVELTDKFQGEYWYLKEKYKNPVTYAKKELKALYEPSGCDFDPKLETISERARLLYVGITRAKEFLFLSAFHSNKGKWNEVLPSKYLYELQRYIERTRKRAGSSSLTDG